MSTVNWNSINKSNDLLTRHGSATRSKCLYKWSQNSGRGKLIHGTPVVCPLCVQGTDDQYHVLYCLGSLSKAKRYEESDILHEILTKLKNHPELITIILKMVQDPNQSLPDIIFHPKQPLLEKPLYTQVSIGWHNFRLGFCSTTWREIQEAYGKHRGFRRFIQSCKQKSQKAVWYYILAI